MALLRLLLVGLLAVIALFAAGATLLFGRSARTPRRDNGPRRSPYSGLERTKPLDDVIDVEATVVSADQREK
jgi:hypothetical protein